MENQYLQQKMWYVPSSVQWLAVIGHDNEIKLIQLCGMVKLGITWTVSLHYRARAIKEGPFRFANLASHFKRIQIFQIDLPLILSTSKYFR